MSDGNAGGADADEGRSDAGRPSRFREMATQLDDEAGDREATADATAEANRAERTGETSDRRDRSAADGQSEGSQRTDRGDDAEGEAEPSDSWEWIDTEDGDETTDATDADGEANSRETEERADAAGADPPTTDETDRASRASSETEPTAAFEAESAATSETEPTAASETSDPESASGPSESTSGERRERKGRIWDSQPSPTETPVEPSSEGGSGDEPDAAPAAAEEFAEASADPAEDSPLDTVSLTPGTAVLVESGSQDDRTGTTCHRLLYDDLERPQPAVLLVRYQRMDPEELRQIATEAGRTKLVSVGYAQDVPASVADAVETVEINNPNDITRLGIVVSGTIDTWSGDDERISVCYDSINVLLNYRDVKRTFRFLHVLLKTLRRGDAVSHFHVDPLAGDPQSISTLKPLFDEIVSIDSVGVTVE